jgi:hypothetical protein
MDPEVKMSQLTYDFSELEKIIALSEKEHSDGLPSLEKLGFKERQVTEAEKREIGYLSDDYVFCCTKQGADYEITVLERHHDTSRVFQIRPDRIHVIVKVSGSSASSSSYSWMAKH